MPKVSILMSVYNTDEYMLKESIKSILNQTFKDFEFIICDDGSCCATSNFLKQLISNDNRCILIKNAKNVGLAQSMNNCIAIANGEYIARMDSDDISKPNRIKEELDFLEEHKEYAFVSCAANLFDEHGVFSTRVHCTNPEKKDMLFGPPFIHAAVMIRKEAIISVGGYRVCKETLRAEDYDLWMRLYSNGLFGYNLKDPLYCIRENQDTYSRRSYKYRIDEAKVRYYGFKKLGLFPLGIIYVIKPLIVGLIPQRILKIIRIYFTDNSLK